MKVSLRTVQELNKISLPPTDELAELINMRLGGIEEIINLNAKYKDARIVRVIECEKHPDADRLSICKIDDGGVVEDIERDENNLIQVVCGAPNVHSEMWAIWLPPKSIVPSSFDEEEPFVLAARKLRGVMSYGMLSAGDELALNSDHEGIIEITDYDVKSGVDLYPGVSFADVLGLNDTIIDIENKMFTHRPDLFGQLGVAREIQAILQPEVTGELVDQKIIAEDWFWSIPKFESVNDLDLTVFNEAGEKTPRFMAVTMKDVDVKPSPLWLQCELIRLGGKPINNVVDVTNYIMLMTAQPVHAYDYDKIRGHKIGARMAKNGEKVHLLNDKIYELDETDIVIADEGGAVGLAGVMGGGDSEVSMETKNIVLEVATFDMYAIRKTSMKYGLFTDAVTRFNKGQSPLQNDRVMAKLMELMTKFAGAIQASDVFDDLSKEVDRSTILGEQIIKTNFINQRLGINLSSVQIVNILRSANFAVYSSQGDDDELKITAPFWRTDIEYPEDIVEEVGRIYGFDRLPRELPSRSIRATPKSEMREFKKQLRDKFSKMGANEVLTYSFVHEKTLKNAMQDSAQAFQLSNALSPDLQYYRLSVLPSLIDKVHPNIKAGHDEFTLFEIGKGHNKTFGTDSESLPPEVQYLDAVYVSKKPHSDAAYFRIRRMIETLADGFGIDLDFRQIDAENSDQSVAPFDLKRSANVFTKIDNQEIYLGVVGELKTQVSRNFKLPEYTAGATILIDELLKVVRKSRETYVPLSRFPSTSRDISLKTSAGEPFSSIKLFIDNTLDKHSKNMTIESELLTIYQPQTDDQNPEKTTTFRLKFTDYNKTLSDKDINPVMKKIETLANQNGYKIS